MKDPRDGEIIHHDEYGKWNLPKCGPDKQNKMPQLKRPNPSQSLPKIWQL